MRDIWDAATSTQPLPSLAGALVLAALALLVTWTPTGYRFIRHGVTIVHEAGHATVAVLTGRQLRGIRLHADTSGVTISRGRPRGPGMVATLAAGYPAPAVLGFASAALLSQGYAVGWLWLMVALCALMLIQIRNFYGLWVLLVAGALVGGATWLLPAEGAGWIAHLLVWALLLAAPRSVVELQRQRGRGGARQSDVDQLAALTGVPATLWVGLFWLICVACLVAGAVLLAP
ncbi:M50 family metallopeptidase [Ornithinimicrobium ciconiae]|uniref:M50 family metallopeptidase n=1 Tax=Ornithinimicrobium ciconiae TaxID=2594265 RepID=A0A516G612_9MICO|nr:M50 family metallopeptidase [Ornithinimicrobium ciconiae]QDO86963.1 M50 family metallopeptidase [Ornithinimicrobium ciconiae]